jgi:hypothetical protein
VEATNRISEDRRDVFLALSNEEDTAAAVAELDLYAPLSDDEAEVLGLEPGRSVADQVRPGHLMQMRTRQRQMRGEIPLGENVTIAQRAYTMLRNYAEPVAQAAGVGLSDRQEDRETTRMFRGFLLREATAFVENERRLPNQREIQEITTLALTASRREGFFGLGGATNRVFMARPNAEYGSDVRVAFSRIPEYQRQRLVRAYIQRGGVIPTNEAEARALIENLYQQELAGTTGLE